MAETGVRRGHVVPRVVVGLGYVVAGVLVILAQVEDVALRWSVILPVAMVVLGGGLLLTALVDTHVRSVSGERP